MADTKVLSVDLDVLKSKAGVLTKLERSLNGVGSTIRTLAGKTGNFWDGSAFDAFVENQTGLSKDISQLKNQVAKSRDNLMQAIAAYEKVEKEIDTMVDNLSTADIF